MDKLPIKGLWVVEWGRWEIDPCVFYFHGFGFRNVFNIGSPIFTIYREKVDDYFEWSFSPRKREEDRACKPRANSF